MVTEKSRPLSAIAPIKLASFCMFHSFTLPHSRKAGSSCEDILYVFVDAMQIVPQLRNSIILVENAVASFATKYCGSVQFSCVLA
jgi:hypothetical protein